MSSLQYRVFFCDYESDLQIAADGAQLKEEAEIRLMMDAVLRSPGSFLGVIDAHGGILQFLVHDDGVLALEIPTAKERGCYTKRATLEFCKEALRRSAGRVRREDFDGLSFEPW